MAVTARVGTINSPGAIGLNSVSGLGITPNLLFSLGSQKTSDITVSNEAFLSTGVAIGTTAANNRGLTFGIRNQNGVISRSRTNLVGATNYLAEQENGANWTNDTLTRAFLDSFDVGGFTRDFTIANVANMRLHHAAIQNPDITNMAIIDFNNATTGGAGSTAFFNIGFEPDFVMIFWNLELFDNVSVPNTKIYSGYGFANNNVDQRAIGISAGNGVGLTFDRTHMRNDSIGILTEWSSDTILNRLSYLGATTIGPNSGFELFVDQLIFGFTATAIAIKGGTWHVGDFTKPAADGAQNILTPGVDPEFIFALGGGNTSFNAFRSDAAYSSFGIASRDLQQRAQGFFGQGGNSDVGATQNQKGFTDNTRLVKYYDFTEAVTGEAELTAMNNGSFDLDWTNCDAEQKKIIFFAMGGDPVPPAGPPVGTLMMMGMGR